MWVSILSRPGIRRLALAAIVLACAWGVAWGIAWLRTPNGPRLVLPDRPLYLGQGRPSQTLSGSFDVWNIGSEELLYAITSTCGCTHVKPQNGSIPSGERLRIEVGVQLEGKPGSERSVRLQFNCNDREHPVSEYTVSAACPDPLHVAPSSVDFGRIVEGNSVARRIKVSDRQDQPLASDAPLTVSLQGAHFRADRSADGTGTAFDITLLPDAPLGYSNGRLLLTLGDAPPVSVVLSAEVVGLVNVVPEVLRLQPGREQTLFVWRTDGTPLGDLVASDVPDGIVVRDMAAVVGNRRRFIVTNNAGQALPEKAQLRLRFTSLEEPAVVDVVRGSASSPGQ